MDERTYGELLDLIYGSAVEPDGWSSTIGRLAESVGGTGGALIQQHQLSREGVGVVSGIDPAMIPPYFSYYAHRNPLLPSNEATVRTRMGSWVPEIFHDEATVPKAVLMRSEFYADFLRPMDFHSVLTIGLHTRGLNGVIINLLRPRRKEQFGSAELADLAMLHPHLIRAYLLTTRLSGLRQIAGDAAGAMERSPCGLVLTDAEGRVRHMNQPAERLCREPGGLSVLAGRLSAPRSADAQRLQGLIGAATVLDPSRRGGGSMALSTPARRLPLSISVAPIRSERSPLFDDGPSALVCITDLEAGVSLPEHRLVELLGLTPAEARVALALLEGGGLREVAASLGVSFYTVRAHLARIFEKTGAGRQAELVRLLMRMIGAD